MVYSYMMGFASLCVIACLFKICWRPVQCYNDCATMCGCPELTRTEQVSPSPTEPSPASRRAPQRVALQTWLGEAEQKRKDALLRRKKAHALPTQLIAPKGDLESGDTNACPICLEPLLPGESTPVLKCGHEFHTSCIVSWAAANDPAACAVCRLPLWDEEQSTELEPPGRDPPPAVAPSAPGAPSLPASRRRDTREGMVAQLDPSFLVQLDPERDPSLSPSRGPGGAQEGPGAAPAQSPPGPACAPARQGIG